MISSITLFFIYKMVLDKQGIEQLGLWSVVTAIISSARIGQLGLSGAVVKFVSSSLALEQLKEASNIVETAFYTTLLSTLVLLITLYPALAWFIQLSVPDSNTDDALALIPYVGIYLFIITISNVFMSGLEGCHRYDIKGYIMISGHILLLITTYFLLDIFGIKGLIISQIIQAIVLTCLGWFFIKRTLNIKRVIPLTWNKNTFMNIWRYGASFQAITISQMLYDPTTKMLLSYFGGLDITGIYEMINRLVIQARSIPITANQVLIPYISEQHTLRKKNTKLYKETFNLIFFISTPYYALLVLFLPLISWFWLDSQQTLFLIFGFILILGAWISTLSSPAYFSFLGIGRLKWVVISHLLIAIINLVLGYIAGKYIPNIGPAIAWSIALVTGSLLTILMNHKENKINHKEIISTDKILFILFIIFYLCSTFWIITRSQLQVPIYISSIFSVIIFIILLIPYTWAYTSKKINN